MDVHPIKMVLIGIDPYPHDVSIFAPGDSPPLPRGSPDPNGIRQVAQLLQLRRRLGAVLLGLQLGVLRDKDGGGSLNGSLTHGFNVVKIVV